MSISNIFAPLLKGNLERDYFAIFIVSIALLCAYISKSRGLSCNRNSKEIPVPGYSVPYVGHLLSLRKNSDKTIKKWHYKLGPIIKIRFGAQTWISISEPNLNHKVFTSLGSETSSRYQTSFMRNHRSVGKK